MNRAAQALGRLAISSFLFTGSLAFLNLNNSTFHTMKTTLPTEYQIRYQHTSWTSADSMDAARREVKNEGRVSRLYYAEGADGLYCYLSQEDKDADDTGASAFAVIRLA